MVPLVSGNIVFCELLVIHINGGASVIFYKAVLGMMAYRGG